MKLLVLVSLVGVSMAAVAVYPAKIGSQVVLDLGPQIRTWTRTRKGGPSEFIKYCGPTEKNVRCAQFVTEDGKVLNKETEAHVFVNGTLVISNIKASDAGSYSSNDEPQRIQKQDDGTYYGTPRTQINVQVN